MISDRIRSERKKAGMTQKELAKKSGVAKVTISQYEQGTRTPRIDKLQSLARALEVPTPFLIGYGNEDGSVADLTLGEIEIRKLGYAQSAAEALSHQIALESQSKYEDEPSSGKPKNSIMPLEHTPQIFLTETAKAEAELVEKTRLICKSVPIPDKDKTAIDAVSAVRVRTVTHFIESNTETLKVLIASKDDE